MIGTSVFLLTACGGGDDKSNEDNKTVGAEQIPDKPRKSTQPTGTEKNKPDGVDVSLPKDVNLVFDWDEPKAKNEAAAMDDAANYLRAIYRGVAKRSTRDAAVTEYSTGDGLTYAKTQIDAWIDGGWTATGTLRHYDATTRSTANGSSVEVAFCADAGKFFGKEVKTKKILTTEPSIRDFDHFKIVMVKFPAREDLWQASKVFVEMKAAKCQ
ncbi:hypothetical protein [Streptomyces apricus]|nr:hypothetical protein [Streptomyces apricus]